ncbi:MAG: 6-bladed beta-propeller [Roseivirga sp.]|nr:6-bladed beta-propeller [Roseivirga sp.]
MSTLKTTLLPVCILLITFLTACGSGESEKSLQRENKLPFLIQVEEARDNKEAVFLSDFASNIEYIQPETSEKSLIGRNAHFYITSDYVFSTAFRQIILFNRIDGSFIREISQYGQGPDEYRNTYPYLHFNEAHQFTYVKNYSNKVVGLNASGGTDLELQLPMDDRTLVSSFAQLEPDLFVGFHSNFDCNQDIKLVLFKQNGEVVKTYKNHLTCVNDNPGSISFDFTEGTFYNWNKGVFFKENYNDTLFQVNQDSLRVRAIFNTGEHSMPYEDKKTIVENGSWKTYFSISYVDETADYIFFTMGFRGESHSGYYDKARNITKLADLKGSKDNRFSNDLDDFLSFKPLYATESNKLVGYLEAPEVLEWFEDNPEKAAKLPPHLKQFENMQEDDNPIIMIVTLKD